MPQQDAAPAPETYPVIKTVGLSGLLVTFAGELSESANRAAIAFKAAVEARKWRGVLECSSSLASTFVEIDPLALPFGECRARLEELLGERDWHAASLPGGRRRFRIPTAFGNPLAPQLEEAAEAAGLAPKEAIEEIERATVRVLTIGFAPGQPYSGELPEHWSIPRLRELTPQVPKGALVVAIRQLIVFAGPTPTGWRHIGQTAFECFRPGSEDPFALKTGDELSFASVSPEALERIGGGPGNGGAEITEIE